MDSSRTTGALWTLNDLFGLAQPSEEAVDQVFNQAALLCCGGDGEVSEDELRWLLGFAAAKGADEAELQRLQEMSKSIDIKLLGELEIPERLKKALIYCATKASSADGVYHVMEGEMIRRIANRLGVSDYIVEQIEDLCRREDELRLRRIQLLAPEGLA
jgi:uncharacterized tellurite resistance protein B-like protein